jgi:membrane protease YdiL (CAAX protease family)
MRLAFAQQRRRQSAARLVPLVVPLAMRLAFRWLGRCLGTRRGYLAAFAAYWATCTAIPIALLGRKHVSRVVLARPEPLPTPRWLAVGVLVGLPMGAAVSELLPAIPSADRWDISTAAAVACVNATAEELLWRGLPTATFPDDPVPGWLEPAAGFTLWHIAPLSARAYRHGSTPFLGATAVIGLGFGWVAWRTRSLRWTWLAHIATDACGLRAARYWLGRA